METILEEGETTASSKTAGITADYVITVDGEEILCGTFGFEITSNITDLYYKLQLVEYTESDTAPDNYELVIPQKVDYTGSGQHLTLFGKVERETFEYVFEKQE